jgi:hypothetical protein
MGARAIEWVTVFPESQIGNSNAISDPTIEST